MPSRRHFLLQSAAMSAGVVSLSSCVTKADPPQPSASAKPAEATPNGFKKAVKIGMVGVPGSLEDKFRVLKELGYDGVELNAPDGPSPDAVKAAIDATGLPVHGVVDSKHWNLTLSDPDPEVRAQGLAALTAALQASKDYGGTSVLLVPGKVKEGVSYDECWQRSIAEIRKALPLAEKLQIQILLENVWNDFLTDPQETARFIDELDSEMVGAYFDVGNTVRYSPPHEWIPILGKRIKKLDIKDFAKSPGPGFGAPLLEGDVDWPKVMDELQKVGYVGWGTAEISGGDRERLAVIADQMNKIFAS